MRVLVVDDHACVRERIAAMLAEVPGVDAVLTCDNGHQAMELLSNQAPNVIVLDLHLRSESGLALAHRIKHIRPETLTIVLTSDPSERHRAECLARGADYFLDKSKDLDVLMRVVAGTVRPADR
jgi:DNA-binding NarL/FixJ family response regulator